VSVPAAADHSVGRRGRKVVVLGGTGFLGSAIVRALLDARTLTTAVARRSPDPVHAALLDGATLVLGDASDPSVLHEVLDGASHLVVTVAAPHPAASLAAPVAQFSAELPILLAALDVLKSRADVVVTFISTGGAIYGHTDTLPLNEQARTRPISSYGVAKLAAERYLLAARDTDGLDVRILRVGNAYGPTQSPTTGQGAVVALLHAAATGTPVTIFGDGSAVRDFVYVDDVASAVVRITQLSECPETVNVGTGVGHDLAELIDIVLDTTGRPITVSEEPVRRSDVGANVLDVAVLSSIIDWNPVDLRKGVALTWKAWQEVAP
jgi:UDP-glucose 4-epimerase